VNALSFSYKKQAFQAFEALLKIPDMNLKCIEPETNRPLLARLLADDHNGFFQAFYAELKVRCSDYQNFLDSSCLITEEDANKILTLKQKGLETKTLETTGVIAYGILLGILTLPAAAVGGIGWIDHGMKYMAGKKLELLALDDPRFQLFVHLNTGKENVKADLEFQKYEIFFKSIIKTMQFINYIKHQAEESRRKVYTEFFKSKKLKLFY
jgi:hypothetical protein